MLGTLMKYELPAIARKLLPIYGAWLIASFLMGILMQDWFNSSFLGRLGILIYVGVSVAVLVMTVLVIIQRYRGSLLGDEGYFYHSLPVTSTAHLWSKLLSTVIWIVLAGCISFLSLMLIFLGLGELDTLFDFFRYIPDMSEFFLMVLEVFVLAVLSASKTILCIYASISIGKQARSHTGLVAVAAFLCFMIIEMILGNFVEAFNLPFLENFAGSFREFQPLFLLGVVVNLVLCTPYFLISAYLLKKRLNLA